MEQTGYKKSKGNSSSSNDKDMDDFDLNIDDIEKEIVKDKNKNSGKPKDLEAQIEEEIKKEAKEEKPSKDKIKDKKAKDEKDEVKKVKDKIEDLNLKKKPQQKKSSDDEVTAPSQAGFVSTSFKINTKYANRVLVYKKQHKDSLEVFQGEVKRIKKKLIGKSKISVYLKINNDRINLYDMPLTEKPARQFLFDSEQISADIDKKDKSIIRIQVNSKEYVFKIEDETQAKDWWKFIQKTAKKNEDGKEAEKSKDKAYKEPHITEKVFTKNANTFDLIQFKEHKNKTLGVILQTIDKDSDFNLLNENLPEILYYDHQSKFVTLREFDELMSKSKVFYYQLVGFDCKHDKLETAQSLIKEVIKESKESKTYSEKDFGGFLQKLYSETKIAKFTTISDQVKKIRFKYVFDEKNTSYTKDWHFEPATKILFADK